MATDFMPEGEVEKVMLLMACWEVRRVKVWAATLAIWVLEIWDPFG